MAVSIKPLLFLSIIAFSFTYITSDPLPEPEPEPEHFSLENILDQLKSHISLLESKIDERAQELRSKDEKIRQMELIIHGKSESIESLQSEIESLQPKGAVDVKEQPSKSYARVGYLENEVDKLRKQAESLSQKKDAVEIREYVAEKKIKELSLKLETLQKVNDEQKIRIHKTERASQVAQKETMKLKFDQAHGEWLPHWLAVHFSNFQYYVVSHWNEHGRQTLNMTIQKVLAKKSQIDKWVAAHFETIYLIVKKWMPTFRNWWLNCISYLRTCIPPLSTKSNELFHTWKNSALHHAINIQEMVGPYLKEARKFTRPYINQVAKMTRPHFDEVRVVFKPYASRMLRAPKIFAKSTAVYHHQVEKMLKNNELTRSLATMELGWFAASALLTIPVIFTFKLYSTIFRKKAKKHRHSSHINHSRRGAKRSHAAR